MGSNSNLYDGNVIKRILANNEYSITAVQNLGSIKSMYFTRELYSRVEEAIKKGCIGELTDGFEGEPEFREYLDVMSFNDQNGKQYLVTVYDNDELWQNPQVINLFLMK